MSLIEQRCEKGRVVTRFCGVRVWRSATEPPLSMQAAMLRRELLTAADVGNMPPARGYARDVQLAGVVLLKEVLRVARENGFHPWTISGSLLGVVRHGGRFVPWDDDVDQGMLRDEYDRFCEVFNEKCREGYYARRRFSRKWNQIKVSHRDLPDDVTSSVMSYDLYHSPLPTLKEKHALFMKVRDAQERNAARFDPQADDAAHRAALDSARREWIMDGKDPAPPETKPAVLRGIEFMTAGWVKETVYDYDDIFPLRTATFEGVDVMVPRRPETVLTYNYGDWAGWPGRLKPHHPASRFNMEKALALRKFLEQHGGES
ncbi:MAG: LicD family protein [Kiritimatiellae bacterium]|nr:LicD family protein [Kiritimatiellia bacterium]